MKLIAAKRAGERTAADPGLLEAWRPRLVEVQRRLDQAHVDSVLPDEPRDPALLEAWLLGARRSRLT